MRKKNLGHTSFMLSSVFSSATAVRGIVEFKVPLFGKLSVLGLRAKDGTLTSIPVLTK